MFENFLLSMIDLPDARLRVRWGGSGPPLLLLHGHPRTHTTWHLVAPLLARKFTVYCPDLRGFGQSSQPADSMDHAGSSKRAKARDCIALMAHFGHDSFHLAGHDRGSYTAFRCAMDHPASVRRVALLDCVPILEALERTNWKFARLWWHWFFFAQAEKPERAILADPVAWYGGDPATMGAENYRDFLEAIRDHRVVHGMVEDYRAGIHLDHIHDAQDRAAGRRLRMPTLVLWSKRDDMEDLYGDVLSVWKPWASQLSGHAIDSGHHMAEEAPEELARALEAFFSSP